MFTSTLHGGAGRLIAATAVALQVAFSGGLAACGTAASGPAQPTPNLAAWPMYGYSLGRTGFNSAETILNAASASRVHQKWDVLAAYGTLVTAEPVVSGGLVYWGSWDGVEHATRIDGTPAWKANLGVSPPPSGCEGGGHSLLGAAAVARVTIGGAALNAVYVGGGNATVYALEAGSGRPLWERQLALPPADIWSSPLVYDGSVYTTTAGFGDCPGVRGQIFQLDAATGAIQHTFDLVPNGCIGGGVWGSPTIDQSNGTLYVATGNDGPCAMAEPYATSLVQLRASDLSVLSAWQLPARDRVQDSDFGATPVLFAGEVSGTLTQLLGVPNKNGVFYAFAEPRIADGPVWQVPIAVGGVSPENGDGSISSGAWDGKALYVAGGRTTVAGAGCRGSVRALSPSTGSTIWEACIPEGAVIGAVSAAPGVIAVGAGKAMLMLSAADGHELVEIRDTDGGFNVFYGGAAIADGVAYIGNANGTLLAYAPT